MANLLHTKYVWNYKSKKGDIHVDSVSGAIKFKLRPGQSFSVNEMDVFESEKQAVTVIKNPTGATGSQQPTLDSRAVNSGVLDL